MSDRKSGAPPLNAGHNMLDLIVQAEAAQSGSQLRIEPDPVLIADGWKLRFTGDSRRVQEAVDLYSEVGFEVRTVPVEPAQLSEECEGCQLVAALHFQTIYIRQRR